MAHFLELGATVSSAHLRQLANLSRLENEPAWTVKQLSSACQGTETVMAIISGDSLVGYMVAAHVLDQADIHTVVVDVAVRGRGYAKQLLQTMLARLAGKGVEQVFLEVRKSNQAAQRLYLGAGFSFTGKRGHYYTNADGVREDALLMMMSIN